MERLHIFRDVQAQVHESVWGKGVIMNMVFTTLGLVKSHTVQLRSCFKVGENIKLPRILTNRRCLLMFHLLHV